MNLTLLSPTVNMYFKSLFQSLDLKKCADIVREGDRIVTKGIEDVQILRIYVQGRLICVYYVPSLRNYY